MRITVPRGTTAKFIIIPEYSDGGEYVYTNSDTARFAVAHEELEGQSVIEKELEYDTEQGGFVLVIEPEDTAELDFGTYLYDIGLQTSEGEYYMLLPCDEFIIDRAVTVKKLPQS